jgi:hypothetical protein
MFSAGDIDQACGQALFGIDERAAPLPANALICADPSNAILYDRNDAIKVFGEFCDNAVNEKWQWPVPPGQHFSTPQSYQSDQTYNMWKYSGDSSGITDGANESPAANQGTISLQMDFGYQYCPDRAATDPPSSISFGSIDNDDSMFKYDKDACVKQWTAVMDPCTLFLSPHLLYSVGHFADYC